jgi:outer membrane lipase/esterase
VWVEQLADQLGLKVRPSQLGGSNYAVGGALLDPRSGPHSLRAQADLYLAKPREDRHISYIVFGGGNDLLAAYDQQAEAVVDTATASLKSIVADLGREWSNRHSRAEPS